MDEAALRRGADSANARWDNHVAILTGDFLFAKSSELTAALGPEAVRIQAETFARLVEGQILETVAAGRGRGPAAALPRGGRRQDRLADRHLRPVRRPLRRRVPRGRGGAHVVRRDRRLRLPAQRRHPRHRLRQRRVRQDPRDRPARGRPDAPGADGAGVAGPRRRAAARAARRRPRPTTPVTPRRWRCCAPTRPSRRRAPTSSPAPTRPRRCSPRSPPARSARRWRRSPTWSRSAPPDRPARPPPG